MIRKEEEDYEFRKKLQNPPKPINSTKPSKEMQEYLDNLENGKLGEKERLEKEEIERKKEKEENKYSLFCPTCRRPTLQRTPQLSYRCGFCGLETNAPLRMALSQSEIGEKEEKKEG